MPDQFDNKRQRLEIWDTRWKSLDGVMDDLTRADSRSILRSPSRQETLRCIVKCLRAFTRSQFEFFRTGFENYWTQKSLHPLEPEYPADSVFGAILDQAASDLEVIQRAADQRAQGSAMVRKALVKADNYAFEVLKPAITGGLLPNGTTVVTYLQKTPAVQVIPYAPVALIGIPFTCVPPTDSEDMKKVARNYLSIPHEVGHYVFWHGYSKVKSERIHNYIARVTPRNPAWCSKWIEEIFADVYGCLFGDPAIALSCQDMQLEYALSKFVESDGEHPNPAVRPYIYQQVLAAKGDVDLAERLRKRWESLLQERDVDGEIILPGNLRSAVSEVIQSVTESQNVTVNAEASSAGAGAKAESAKKAGAKAEAAKKPVNRVIDAAYNLLPRPNGAAPESPAVADMEDVYNKFGDHLVLVGDNSSDLDKKLPELDCSLIPEIGSTDLWIDAIKKSDSSVKLALPQDVWVRVLQAGGWTNKGGGGNPKIT
jgi:hypothetical protein